MGRPNKIAAGVVIAAEECIDRTAVKKLGERRRACARAFRAQRLVLITCLMTIYGFAHAQERETIGPWELRRWVDRFDDSKGIAAINVRKAFGVLGLRCIKRQLTIAIGGYRAMLLGRAQGDLVKVRFRVDRGEIIDEYAGVIDASLLQIWPRPTLVRALMAGKQVETRIVLDTDYLDQTFDLARTDEAFKPVLDECPSK